LRLDEAVELALQVAEGLAAAHERGIVHRDIKPGNIMITTKGRPKIMDFGLAKSPGQTKLTRAGTTTGTVAYMSPEQSRGEDVDRRTDIWSFGAMLYEMLTGRRPFRGDRDQAIIHSILNDEPEPITGLRTGVPIELERIAQKAMAKRADERYQHVDDMMVDLRGLRNKLEAPTQIIPARPVAEESSTPLVAAPARDSLKRIWIPAAIVIVAVLGFFALKPVIFDRVPVTEARPIVVVSFENQTGDPSYDHLRTAIPNLLITSFEQSRLLRVTTWERLHDLLAQAGKEDVGFIDRDLGFELCRMDGVGSIVLGSFTKAGDMFATDAKLLDVNTKTLVVSASARGEGESSILRSQIDELSREICRGVGLPEHKGEKGQASIAEATTTSMEAYNHFLRGRASLERYYVGEAKRELQAAVEIDPSFAMAYTYLGLAHEYGTDWQETVAAMRQAMSVAHRVTGRERLYIEAFHAHYVERDLRRMTAVWENLTREYPKEKRAYVYLGWSRFCAGEWEAAIEAYEGALELDPSFGDAWNDLAYAYADAGDLDRALECAQRYVALRPGDANPLDSTAEMYFRMGRLDEALANYTEAFEISPHFVDDWRVGYVHALREDYEEASRWVDRFAAKAASRDRKAQAQVWMGLYSAWLGSFGQCRRDLDEARDLARADSNRLWEDQAGRTRAWSFLLRGEPERGRAFFESWLESVHEPSYPPAYVTFDPPVQVYAAERSLYLGLADLRGGNLQSARSRLSELESLAGDPGDLNPLFWSWMEFFRDSLAAELLLAEG
ncbi:protein kinase, partial [bacterium]|nr:protein kinase [bacterium]